MPLTFRFRKFLSTRLSSFGLSVVALCAGLSHNASLAAQQTATGSPGPIILDASATDAPAPADSEIDSSLQAAATPAQSSGNNGSAPQNQPAQNAQDESNGQQTKRILGIIPNFRSVSSDQKLPPETVKDKFVSATEDSFDYSSIFIPAVIAVYDYHERATPEFHQGAAGYARYFWHSAVDQTSENYTLGHGGFFKRTGYAPSAAPSSRAQTPVLKSSM
jgi:hypothetical protein